jgi:hypothetical protein
MAVYALTVFLSSFLLFQVQPLIGRYILPWYGGSPAVWTTCMLFFQVVLLAGYGYAHLATNLKWKSQRYLHLVLLLAALLFLPIAPSPDLWKPAPDDAPVLKILLLLLANIGVPYLLLSATAPLVQHWFVRSFPGRSPYRLYALSNFASLLALLSYPFLVEPRLTLARQVTWWGWGFAAFVLCCGWCALRPGGGRAQEGASEPAASVMEVKMPSPQERTGLSPMAIVMWLLLSACGSALLLATTNQLCQEVAVVPFLWVTPLALYLVTFAICFNSDRASDRLLWGFLLIGAVILACRVLYLGVTVTLGVQILVYLAALFTCCMLCHGELARSRPDPRQLTAYYLIIATGGALGGVSVALAAPFLFDGFWEYPLALAASCLVILLAWFRNGAFAGAPRWLPLFLAAGQLALLLFTGSYLRTYQPQTLFSTRNFYGVLRVIRDDDAVGAKRTLMHGRVVHGSQYTDPDRRRWPTTYYGPDSAVGLALRLHPRRLAAGQPERSLRVGIIGLGTGTLAAYGEKGDTFRFYEINPAVVRLSDRWFSFRRESAARVEVVTGDARIMLESELKRGEPQRFDLLIVDAFSSDAIPIHLLTRECFAVYLQHLNPDGILLVHITNRFLDLAPVVRAQGEAAGYRTALVSSVGDDKLGVGKADWMILTRNGKFLDAAGVRAKLAPDLASTGAPLLWTDDFAGLWQILKR